MVRKVVKRTTHRVVGYHASRKTGELVPWESQIERAYFEWLEIDPDVIWFQAQPRTFNWSNGRYTPDALVRTHKGSFFAEVKPDDVFDDVEEFERLLKITRRLERDGFDFRLIVRSKIFTKPLRDNVVSLMRFIRGNMCPKIHQKFMQLTEHGPCSLRLLEAETGVSRSTVMRAIAQGYLALDITQHITANSLVRHIQRR